MKYEDTQTPQAGLKMQVKFGRNYAEDCAENVQREDHQQQLLQV